MARPLRIEYEGAFYHITARGNERKRIYWGKADYEKFKDYLKESQDKYGYVLHCYVLMANHYHLVIETPNGNMSQVMQYINGSYTNYVNRKRKRSGHLFQGRYKAILVDKDRYLLELSRYVHLNPVRAKMVETPAEYVQSSYGSYISKNQEEIVTNDLILEMVSRRKKDAVRLYREFVDRAAGTKQKSPLDDVYGGMVLGSIRFIKKSLSRIEEGILQQQEVSHRRKLNTILGTDEVIEALMAHYHVSEEELYAGRNGSKKVSLYLLKKNTGLTNRELGDLFGGLSYSAVSKAHKRFCLELEGSKVLQKEVGRIMRKMSNVKG